MTLTQCHKCKCLLTIFFTEDYIFFLALNLTRAFLLVFIISMTYLPITASYIIVSTLKIYFFLLQIGSSEKTDPELVTLPDGFDKNNVLHIKLDNEGCFNAVVKYNGVPLSQGQLTVISLNCKCLF